jgi:hypothetical protein
MKDKFVVDWTLMIPPLMIPLWTPLQERKSRSYSVANIFATVFYVCDCVREGVDSVRMVLRKLFLVELACSFN